VICIDEGNHIFERPEVTPIHRSGNCLRLRLMDRVRLRIAGTPIQ
jgi:hypothetical protein